MGGTFAGNDRFLVLSELGMGGMGVVYEALDLERNVRVAIKTLRIGRPQQLLRLKDEFRALRDIRHHNLVELGELFEDQGTWFFTMSLVDGVDFITYIRGGQSAPGFEERRLWQALRGLGAGLIALHSAGKIHCDVKPSNVLVTAEGQVVLLDFGVTTELRRGDREGNNPRAGSPLYMAPEQAAGLPVGPAADWYAVGVLIFLALTGDVPFRSRNRSDVLRLKQREPPPHPAQRQPGLPDELAGLCARLLARKPEERPDETEICSILGIGPSDALPQGSDGDERLFVGRAGALARLDDAYRRALRGQTVSVFIEGDSGVGKSTLADHFVAGLASETTSAVFRGQCHTREFVRYNAFDGIVDGLTRFLRTALEASSLIAHVDHVGPLLHLFPVLRNVRGLAKRAEKVTGDVRRYAFQAVRQLLTAIAQHIPLVLLIDDIHWADADSLALLRELVGTRSTPPMLLLATARRLEDGSSCAATRIPHGECDKLELQGLEQSEARELAQRLLSRFSNASVSNLDTIVAETGGHPLFMDELVRYFARVGHGARPRPGAHLDDALRARIAELDTETQRILQLIAVAGASVSRNVAAKTSGLPAESFERGLSMLRSANLVRIGGRDADAHITVYHARVREALYSHLDEELRVSLHFQLARVMESRGADARQLAMHFHRGADPDKAAHYAIAAARDAARALAFDQAAELYQLALAALPVAATPKNAHRDLLSELGMALQNAGRTRESADAYVLAAIHAGDSDWLELHRRAAEQLLAGGYMEEGLAAVHQVLARSGMKLPKTGKRALPGVAWNFFRLQRHDLTWQTPSREQMSRPWFAVRATRIDVCWTAGAGLGLVDTLRGVFFSTRGARLALRLGEPYRLARSLCTAAVSAAALGSKSSAARMTEASLRAAQEHGSNQAMFYAQTARFIYDFFYKQKWRQCVESGRQLEQVWHSAGRGRGFEIDFVIQFYSWALGMTGDVPALTRFFDTFVSDARRVGNRLLEVALRVYHCLVHLAVDEPDRARADVGDAIESWLPGSSDFHLLHAWATFSQGAILLYRGQPFAGEELTANVRRLRQSPLHRTRWVLWQDHYMRGRFSLARAVALAPSASSRRIADELANASSAAKRLQRSRAPVARAWGSLVAAGIARVRGDLELAVTELKKAQQVFVDTQSSLHAIAATYRLGQTLDGSTGQALMDTSLQALAQRGVVRPDRMLALLAPGWE